MGAPPFSGMIVFSKREAFKKLFRTESKTLGLAEAVIPASEKDCIEQLFYLQNALLVLDYDVGAQTAAKILQAAKGHHNIETRPLLLVVENLTQNVAATAAEFGVSMILTGELNPAVAKERLGLIAQHEVEIGHLKEKLVQVAFARQRKDLVHSTKLLLDLKKQFPSHPRVIVEVAENLIQQESWEEALKLLQPLNSKKPPYLRAVHLIGRCLAKLGQPEAAIEAFESANFFNPNNVARLVDLGNLLLENNKVEQAKSNFQSARELAPDDKEAKAGMGKCLLLEGDINDALAIMREMSGPRELASVFNTAAVIAIRHGEFEKGLQLYEQSEKALGGNRKLRSRINYNKGIGYHRWRKPAEAQAAFKQALLLDPGFADAAHNLKATELLINKGDSAPVAVGQTSQPEPVRQENCDNEEFMKMFEGQEEDEFD